MLTRSKQQFSELPPIQLSKRTILSSMSRFIHPLHIQKRSNTPHRHLTAIPSHPPPPTDTSHPSVLLTPAALIDHPPHVSDTTRAPHLPTIHILTSEDGKEEEGTRTSLIDRPLHVTDTTSAPHLPTIHILTSEDEIGEGGTRTSLIDRPLHVTDTTSAPHPPTIHIPMIADEKGEGGTRISLINHTHRVHAIPPVTKTTTIKTKADGIDEATATDGETLDGITEIGTTRIPTTAAMNVDIITRRRLDVSGLLFSQRSLRIIRTTIRLFIGKNSRRITTNNAAIHQTTPHHNSLRLLPRQLLTLLHPNNSTVTPRTDHNTDPSRVRRKKVNSSPECYSFGIFIFQDI
ncbi:hypothetical protein BLNAU_1682 [Blattamonas nauphoetae]|uniref:Uncharacterized protein n=1 Tax=Blattamonas nauphoetae TaxID=2049346 RepID=A0ABQ9YHD0_9EUKA|nr:hypothetical protein BLNAU_1682 [Blattamonas nauphoetae]